jgi:ligand-binding sensor domain-containing protein
MYLRHSLLVLISIALSGISVVNAEKLNKTFLYRHFDSAQGLSGNQTSHMMQDSKGYLWISHWKGFSRFDGNVFKNYRDTDGLLASSSFECIEFIPEHFLIQHIKGVSIFTPQKGIHTISFPDSIRGLRIGKGLYHNKRFWIFNCLSKTSGKICHLESNKQWYSVNELFSDTVLSVIPASKDQPAHIFTENKVYQLINDQITLKGNLKHKYRSFAVDQNGDCTGFAEADSQFYRISFQDSVVQVIPAGLFAPDLFGGKLPDTFIILPESEGIVYYNNRYELFRINREGIKPLGRNFSLIRKMMIDKEGNLWIATEEGIFNFFRLDFERIKLTFTDKSDMFWSIAAIDQNKIITGRFGFGFVELEDSVWKPVKMNYAIDQKTGMDPNSPLMGALSYKGEAWFPIWKGLVKFSKSGQEKKIALTTTPQQLYIDPESTDTIFAATTGGMMMISQNDNIRFIGQPAGFSGIQNESIVRDKFSRFWLGSSQGPLQIYDGKKVFAAQETSAPENVISSQKDSDGNLWFGTDKGLYYYDYNEFVRIKPEILTESIDLLVNYNDSILVGVGFKKLVLVNYLRKPFGIQIYDEHEMGVIQNTAMIDHHGDLWFSSMYDLIRFNPIRLINHYSIQVPEPFVSSVEYSHDNVHWFKNKPEQRTNNLRFNYIALTYKNQDQLIYKYFLENFDTWSQPTMNREVYYTNLDPGNYRLGVQCSVDGQNWSTVTFSDYASIEAAWYQLFWVRAVLIILLLIFIFLFGLRINQSISQTKIRKLTEQKNLNQLQLQLVRSRQIPHFSGNALANIEHFIFQADLKQANKYLSMFSRLLNQTMQDADKPVRSLKKELELVVLYLELEKMRFDDSFEYELLIDPEIDQNIVIPNMLLQTWVENAVRHGLRNKQGKGMIWIKATQSDKALTLSVEDNGIGRIMADRLGTKGTGKGLQILNGQFEIYNQFNENKIEMVIDDLENKDGTAAGTRFGLSIPEAYVFIL